MRRRPPIGIRTFRRLREDGCYYVDKTDHIRRLIAGGSRYFLSRPRRFGKSLLVDTLKELFEGSRELFEGLRIHAHWDWSVRFPVVRLDFSGGGFAEPGALHANVMAQLDEIERGAPVETRYDTAPERFRHLIRTLHRGTGRRVVVLVDEYDKPILDALGDPALARRNRDYLRGLYGGVKFCDAQVKFCLLTGVSRFSKVSLFSELNNLTDLTLDPRYSTICGYTEADLERVFAPELAGLDRERIREWYDGYAWRGADRVYNPFDVLLLFDSREFEAHWFETATPSFLVETLMKRRVGSVEVECMAGTRELLSTFDVERIEPEALLFQTGYLTIRGEEDRGGRPLYRLGYPNREVRESLNEHLLRAMTPAESRRPLFGVRLRELLFGVNYFGRLATIILAGSDRRGSRSTAVGLWTVWAVLAPSKAGEGNALSRRNKPARRGADAPPTPAGRRRFTARAGPDAAVGRAVPEPPNGAPPACRGRPGRPRPGRAARPITAV